MSDTVADSGNYMFLPKSHFHSAGWGAGSADNKQVSK